MARQRAPLEEIVTGSPPGVSIDVIVARATMTSVPQKIASLEPRFGPMEAVTRSRDRYALASKVREGRARDEARRDDPPPDPPGHPLD
jgi:hypothetical protein